MSIPQKSDPCWMALVTGQRRYEFRFLAAKIMLGRLHMIAEERRTQEVYRRFADQLHDLLEASSSLPSVQSDLEQLFG